MILDQEDFGLSQSEREWMRGDLLCPSCRCGGASLVRSDVKKGTQNTRQAHFRFIDQYGHSAHKIGCDFFPIDETPGVVRDVEVRFDANDKDTKIIRELVCKAIATGECNREDIFRLRSWFLMFREANSFVVKGIPLMADWAYSIRRLPFYEAISFDPLHARMPGFDRKRAAQRDLAFHYRDFVETMPRVLIDADVRDRTKRILSGFHGSTLIAMAPLRDRFGRAARLAALMADYGKLALRRKVGPGIFGNAPPALLAFSSLLLFVSDWSIDEALRRFSRLLPSPVPEDLTMSNVIGLNPFHDFGALELAHFISRLPPSTERPYDFDSEIAAVLSKIDAGLSG
ncbi:hypothetical protein [Mesorhizobium sp. L2C084A000]|uniref:hypothetical protein n=1 Tax=Mesorhizobium sp. L2C084A000 TaxID=1287116 RepID=UPI0012DC4046|nr:hypothetical protein [Mesorhizobium sp. L2C084A000]